MRRGAWAVVVIGSASLGCDEDKTAGPGRDDAGVVDAAVLDAPAIADAHAVDAPVDAAVADAAPPDAAPPEPIACPIPGCPPVTPDDRANLRDVWIAPGGNVWIVSEDGLLGLRTPDASWCWCTPSTSGGILAVWGSDDRDLWMVGGGAALRYDGVTITRVVLGGHVGDVWGTGPDDVWVVGWDGLVRHFDGVDWSAHDLGASHSLRAVWSASPRDVWIAGATSIVDPDSGEAGTEGEVFQWDPTTATWERVVVTGGIRASADFVGLHGSGPDDVWAVGEDYPDGAAEGIGVAIQFVHGTGGGHGPPDALREGRVFTDVVAGAPGAEQGCWITGGPGMIRFDGTSWSEVDPDVTADLVAIDARGDAMWAVGYGGRVARWSGTAWVRDR